MEGEGTSDYPASPPPVYRASLCSPSLPCLCSLLFTQALNLLHRNFACDGSHTEAGLHSGSSILGNKQGPAAVERPQLCSVLSPDQSLTDRCGPGRCLCVAAEHCVCVCVCMFSLGQQLAGRAVTHPPRLWRHPAPNRPGCRCAS